MDPALKTDPTIYKTPPTKSIAVRIDRNGGRFEAGMIRGVSLATIGEALGHGEWLDSTFIGQVAAIPPRNGQSGIKARFTHPTLSSDGLGRFVGRVFNRRVEGDQAVGDIHFSKSAHDTPDGNLAKYLMDLAEEDPRAFAMSIAFRPDVGAMEDFEARNKDEDGRFVSPDEDNANNFPHIRLAELVAVDFVDEPAANPGGLFHRGNEIAAEADCLAEFALGLTEEKPELCHFDLSADRVKAYVRRFLETHSLELNKMADNKASEFVTRDEFIQFSETIGGKLDEIAAGMRPAGCELDTTEVPSAEELQLAERKRAKDLYALAESSGISKASEHAQKWIDGGLSVVEAKAAIGELAIANNSLSADLGESDPDPHAAFRKEFRQARDAHAAFGVTDEDAYVRMRCRDEGLPIPYPKDGSLKPSVLMP